MKKIFIKIFEFLFVDKRQWLISDKFIEIMNNKEDRDKFIEAMHDRSIRQITLSTG